jgi:hypothetical protein
VQPVSYTQDSARPIDRLLAAFPGARRSGAGWMVRCPNHEDREASLSIRDGADGRVLLNCFAGCPNLDILTAVGLDWSALFPRGSAKTRVWRGIVPYTKGHPALESFGDDTAAAMLGELGRMSHIRGSLDQRIAAAFLVIATALGISQERFEEHLRDAMSTELP